MLKQRQWHCLPRIEAEYQIRPRAEEIDINEGIYALATRMYGISRYWNKRIVRAGLHLGTYDENPPDPTVTEDDIIFLDLGPVFEESEADFGRTFVIGNDPLKLKLRYDIEEAFESGKRYFQGNSDITGAQPYAHAKQLAEQTGWEYGGPIAGHLIGVLSHEKIPGGKVTLYVHPNNTRMRATDAAGRKRHWILEIRFVDHAQIGGFYEELLSIG